MYDPRHQLEGVRPVRAEDFFTTEWQGELPRLRRLMIRAGVRPDDVEDILQETAARLYAAWGRVFEDRPIRPLITTIALNIARDYHRRANPLVQPVADVPDAVAVEPISVERVAIARLEVSRTRRALAVLSDNHRRAIADAVSDQLAAEQDGPHRSPAATRMAISRARRRLAVALELTVGVIGAVVGSARRFATAPATPAVAAAGVGAAVLVALVLSGPASSPGAQPVSMPAAGAVTAAHHPAPPSRPVVITARAATVSGRSVWSQRPGYGWASGVVEAVAYPAQTRSDCEVRILDVVPLPVPCPPVK